MIKINSPDICIFNQLIQTFWQINFHFHLDFGFMLMLVSVFSFSQLIQLTSIYQNYIVSFAWMSDHSSGMAVPKDVLYLYGKSQLVCIVIYSHLMGFVDWPTRLGSSSRLIFLDDIKIYIRVLPLKKPCKWAMYFLGNLDEHLRDIAEKCKTWYSREMDLFSSCTATKSFRSCFWLEQFCLPSFSLISMKL